MQQTDLRCRQAASQRLIDAGPSRLPRFFVYGRSR